jgi:exosome complex component RRP41
MYKKRFDDRKFDETRPMKAEISVVPNVTGSSTLSMGDTKVIAAVEGPKPLHPRRMQDPEGGLLRCHYDMMSFSVDDRKRPGPSRREIEIGLVMRNALQPFLLLKEFPKAVVDLFTEVYQADAGTRCASISAASLALADAGVPMRDLVAAVSVGKVGDKIVLDLTKKEEDFEEGATDMPVSMSGRTKEISALQLDGSITMEEFKEALKLAEKGCQQIYEFQKKTLKSRYEVD